jgi:DNA polymerase phi
MASEACDDPESLTISQVKDLMKLSLLAIRQAKRAMGDANLHAVIGASNWILLSQKLKTSRFKTAASLHALCQQLLAAIHNPDAMVVGDGKRGNQKKRKAEDAKETGMAREHQKNIKKIKY